MGDAQTSISFDDSSLSDFTRPFDLILTEGKIVSQIKFNENKFRSIWRSAITANSFLRIFCNYFKHYQAYEEMLNLVYDI